MADVKVCMLHRLLLLLLLLLLLTVTVTDSHPQCLDFRAPFKPDRNLRFCVDYSTVGCCGSQDEIKILEEYEYIRSRASPEDWSRCQVFMKDILCQKCSPFAAHIYDAEGTSKARQFPGLCTRYCHNFYDNCKRLVSLLDIGLDLTSSLAERDRFCQQVAITDALYCYPDLLTQPMLLRNLTNVHTSHATSGCLCLEPVTDNLANPLWARHAGDGSGRLFVAEQKGRVRIYNTITKRWRRSCFLDYTNKAEVSSETGDETGFLGMAFHPQYSKNGRFFVYYFTSRKPGDVLPPDMQGLGIEFESKIVVSEARVSAGDPHKADASYERVLLEVFQPYENHNGGELMFGLDGFLYVFIGDGGGAGDPLNAGQNKSLLLGKVLRIDVDSDPTKPYTIPKDNPFVGEPKSQPEIYAYGIRNIWRCGLDRGGESPGRIVCGDVGQNAFEEIDVLKKGANYGWNSREGFECYDDPTCGQIGKEELPIHAYSHKIGQSVTGGVFYWGCENPALLGKYIYGDFSSSRLFSLTESGGVWRNQNVDLCGPSLCQGGYVGSFNDYILSFGEDEDGEIYLLSSKSGSSAECDGTLYKIVDPVSKRLTSELTYDLLFRRNDPSSCRSDLSHTKRVPLTQRGKILPSAKSDQLVATITTRVRSWKPKVGNSTDFHHSEASTVRTHSGKPSATSHHSHRQQRSAQTGIQPHRNTPWSPSPPWENGNGIFSATSQDFRATSDKPHDDDVHSAQTRTSMKMSGKRKSGLKGTPQGGSRQTSATRAPHKQRKRGDKKAKMRGRGRGWTKRLKQKSGVCTGR